MLRWSSGGDEPSDLQALALDVSSASPAGTEAGLLIGAVMRVHSRGASRARFLRPSRSARRRAQPPERRPRRRRAGARPCATSSPSSTSRRSEAVTERVTLGGGGSDPREVVEAGDPAAWLARQPRRLRARGRHLSHRPARRPVGRRRPRVPGAGAARRTGGRRVGDARPAARQPAPHVRGHRRGARRRPRPIRATLRPFRGECHHLHFRGRVPAGDGTRPRNGEAGSGGREPRARVGRPTGR